MKENVKALFQPITIGGIPVKNRIVMPPMVTNFSSFNGTPERKMVQYLRNRAKGGVGLIIQEAASVSWPEGKISDRQIRINDPVTVADLFDITDSVHAFGAKIIIQLHHGGFLAHSEYTYGAENVSSSDGNGARAMTKEEIKKVVDDFITSAVNAKNARYDGIEIHAAHMYLLNQFINPAWNKRTDEYGGSLENRFRIIREIAEGIREKCGRPFIIGLRLGAVDFPQGNTVGSAVEICKMAEECGIDMLNISVGFYEFAEVVPTQYSQEAPYTYISEAIKKAVNIPVAIVGKLRTPEICAQIIDTNQADLVVIGRQMICDPEWPNKILMGKEETIRTCLNCLEGCMERMSFADSGIRCVINPYVGVEDLYNENVVAASAQPKTIVVVGGGIAGMQYSIISKKQGHNVILLEKSEQLGGQMILAGMTPFKKEVRQALDWFKGEVERQKIDVRLQREADMEQIRSLHPDHVVLAMGCEFAEPAIDGIENTVRGDRVIRRKVEVGQGKKVAVIGGGVAGCELAHRIALEGSEVTILETLPDVCGHGGLIHSEMLKAQLGSMATILTSVKVIKIDKDKIFYKDADGKDACIDIDMAIHCAGQKKVSGPLYEQLIQEGFDVYRIGENGISNFQNATREALQLAYTL